MSKCKICGKDGFHKLSCPNNKERQKRLLIDMMKGDEELGLYNKAIPTLEGEEAEDIGMKAIMTTILSLISIIYPMKKEDDIELKEDDELSTDND